jgi:hypothetical protein
VGVLLLLLPPPLLPPPPQALRPSASNTQMKNKLNRFMTHDLLISGGIRHRMNALSGDKSEKKVTE